MEKLAIFDVDYTLTKSETLMEFYLFMMRKDLRLLKYAPRNIGSALLYLIKIFDERQVKESFLKFIDGLEEEKMQSLVKQFYDEKLSKILYVDAIDTIKKLKKEGYKVYLISASPEFYLKELYNIKEVDMVIGSRFTVENGIHRRTMVGKNNKGEEKVKRLMEVLKEQDIKVDFENSYMYSDSLSDLPLFKLVGHPYLINSKKKDHNIEVLHWK